MPCVWPELPSRLVGYADGGLAHVTLGMLRFRDIVSLMRTNRKLLSVLEAAVMRPDARLHSLVGAARVRVRRNRSMLIRADVSHATIFAYCMAYDLAAVRDEWLSAESVARYKEWRWLQLDIFPGLRLLSKFYVLRPVSARPLCDLVRKQYFGAGAGGFGAFCAAFAEFAWLYLLKDTDRARFRKPWWQLLPYIPVD